MGFLIFLLILSILNILVYVIKIDFYANLIIFLDTNIFLFFLITLSSVIFEILWFLGFPFNLPAPFFNAFEGTFILAFMLRVLALIESYLKTGVVVPIKIINSFYLFLFIIILIIGYTKILLSLTNVKTTKQKPILHKKKKFH